MQWFFRLPLKRQGELLIAGEALLWSLFPVLTLLSLNSLTPLTTAGLSFTFAAGFFAVTLSLRRRWHEIMVRSAWRDIFLTTFFIVGLHYGGVFIGSAYTTAGNISILLLMEVFFSFLILNLWGKERFHGRGAIGGALMMAGAGLVLFKGQFHLNGGDLIIFIAVVFAPIGNFFSQRARQQVGSDTILFLRSVAGGVFYLSAALLFDPPRLAEIRFHSIWFAALNGFFLFGLSKIFWIEAIHRIPISKAVSLGAVTPALTLLFAYLILGDTPTFWQIGGLIPIIAGVQLLTSK